MTLESWFSNLEQTPTRQVSLPALFKLLARYSRHVFKQRTEQNDLIIPISTDLQYLNLIAITLRLNWLSRSHELDASHSTDNNSSIDSSDDYFRYGCRHVSHHYQQKSFLGPLSPGKLHDRMCLLFLHVRLLSLKDAGAGADIVYCWKTWMISLKTICFIPGFARLLKKMDDHAHIFSNPEEFLCPSEIVARPLHFCSSGNWANEQREPLHPENRFQY